MEGIFYYWFMWASWIVVTFWMKKGKKRVWYSFFILLNLSVSQMFVQLNEFKLGLSYLLFALLGLIGLLHQKRYVHTILTVFTIALSYASLQMFYVYDPVWFIYDVRIFCSFIAFLLAIFLGKDNVHSFSCLLTGLCYGELIFWFVISSIYKPVTVGDVLFLETVVFTTSFFLFWVVLKSLTSSLELLIEKNVKEKEG